MKKGPGWAPPQRSSVSGLRLLAGVAFAQKLTKPSNEQNVWMGRHKEASPRTPSARRLARQTPRSDTDRLQTSRNHLNSNPCGPQKWYTAVVTNLRRIFGRSLVLWCFWAVFANGTGALRQSKADRTPSEHARRVSATAVTSQPRRGRAGRRRRPVQQAHASRPK